MLNRIGFVWISFSAMLSAQDKSANDLFEASIRPILVTKCSPCHSSKLKAPMGNFTVDTKAGLARGGDSGPAVVPGKPEASRLLKAISYSDPGLQMPPGGKLTDNVVAAFRKWIEAGAPDPRVDSAQPVAAARGIDIEKGRKWWAFQPVRETSPVVADTDKWVKNKIDAFILAKLEAKQLKPSKEADRRTLIRRASLDLTGLAPTFEETEAFVKDSSPDAYAKLVGRLLASPHYGEHWGRHWLDVARFGEDNPLNGQSIPFYPFAWRYRDWVIEALDRDVPYDRFVKLQVAADEMPGVSREDERALGFLGLGPITHKDARLSAEVIETFAADDWDERVDTVSRGLLGMTIACARCHDHKFDPIRTQDYYALAGVFASTQSVARPLFAMEPAYETRLLWLEQRVFQLTYLADLMTKEPGTKRAESAAKVVRYKDEIKTLMAEVSTLAGKYPPVQQLILQYAAWAKAPYRNVMPHSEEWPFFNGVYDAGLWIDSHDTEVTLLDYRPGQARDLPVFRRGNVVNTGDVAPRAYPAVLTSSAQAKFTHGSGRLDLGDCIFSDSSALAARVIVNRVWGWHFGRALVATPSDFGVQGERPTHPELLDDLSARLIRNGWSLKWLHREIVLSATYRQSGKVRADSARVDEDNRLLWRYPPHRLDFESFRDSILRASGSLDESLYGPSLNLGESANHRRTIYSLISREYLDSLFPMYDLPNPSQHSPARNLTTTPLQQLFVMNSSFIQEQASRLAQLAPANGSLQEKVRFLFRRVLARDPDPTEMALGAKYLESDGAAGFAQALLSAGEFIYWP